MSFYALVEMTRIKHGNLLSASVLKCVGEHALTSGTYFEIYQKVIQNDGRMDRWIDGRYVMK